MFRITSTASYTCFEAFRRRDGEAGGRGGRNFGEGEAVEPGKKQRIGNCKKKEKKSRLKKRLLNSDGRIRE